MMIDINLTVPQFEEDKQINLEPIRRLGSKQTDSNYNYPVIITSLVHLSSALECLESHINLAGAQRAGVNLKKPLEESRPIFRTRKH